MLSLFGTWKFMTIKVVIWLAETSRDEALTSRSRHEDSLYKTYLPHIYLHCHSYRSETTRNSLNCRISCHFWAYWIMTWVISEPHSEESNTKCIALLSVPITVSDVDWTTRNTFKVHYSTLEKKRRNVAYFYCRVPLRKRPTWRALKRLEEDGGENITQMPRYKIPSS